MPSGNIAQYLRQFCGDRFDLISCLLECLAVEAEYRPGYRHGGYGLSGVIPDRGTDAEDILLMLLIIYCPAALASALELFPEGMVCAYGFRGEWLERIGPEVFLELIIAHLGEEYLADCGAVERNHLADAGVHPQRVARFLLEDINGIAVLEYSHVDCLSQILAELLRERLCRIDQVDVIEGSGADREHLERKMIHVGPVPVCIAEAYEGGEKTEKRCFRQLGRLREILKVYAINNR